MLWFPELTLESRGIRDAAELQPNEGRARSVGALRAAVCCLSGGGSWGKHLFDAPARGR